MRMRLVNVFWCRLREGAAPLMLRPCQSRWDHCQALSQAQDMPSAAAMEGLGLRLEMQPLGSPRTLWCRRYSQQVRCCEAAFAD